MSIDNIVKAGEYLIARLKEPSSHNAIGVICLAAGTQANFGVYDSALLLLGTIFTTLGFFIKENKE